MIDRASVLSAAGRFAAGEEIAERDAAPTVDRIDVYANPADALDAWTELEAIAAASAYQTQKWVLPWIESVGRSNGVRPAIVVARARNGAPVALFPFGIVQRGAVRVAQFLGGRDSNANLGLIRPGAQLDRSDVGRLLRATACQARPRPDAFVLLNQPERWEGAANPLALLPRQRSPSDGYSATLGATGASFVNERLSGDARKKLRKKRKKLSEWGPVSHIVAAHPDEVSRIIDAFFAQKLERFRQKHIASHFGESAARQLLVRTCLAGLKWGSPAVELHALCAGNRIVAVYAGMLHRRRFHAMINSFDPDPEIARTSPGDLLLMSMMQMMCDRGCAVFDLGIGEARYKSTWCDVAEPLFDTLCGVTLKGHAYVLGKSAALRLKRSIKQNKRLYDAVEKLREKLRAGKPPRAARVAPESD